MTNKFHNHLFVAGSMNVIEQKLVEDSVSTEPLKFKCEICGLHEKCDYYGKAPDFIKKIRFTENCYVMKDPFSPPSQSNNAEFFILLGAKCNICNQCVCRNPSCSFLYNQTFCLKCAQSVKHIFPIEVQSKLQKQIFSKS